MRGRKGRYVTSIEILGDGDVRLEFRLEDGRTDSRRFRAHFGHVVEVSGDRLRRVGADLSYRQPSLLVRATLAETLAETVRQAGPVARPAMSGPGAHRPITEPAPMAPTCSSANGPTGLKLTRT